MFDNLLGIGLEIVKMIHRPNALYFLLSLSLFLSSIIHDRHTNTPNKFISVETAEMWVQSKTNAVQFAQC